MVSAEILYDEIKTFLTSSSLDEIKDLDMSCKSVIQRFHCEPTQQCSENAFIKIQAVLDYMYEMINIGNWKEVKPHIRKALTIASYLKLLIYLKQNYTVELSENIIKEAFRIIDHGLLFGCPLDSDPKILQKCATTLNKVFQYPCKSTTTTEEKISCTNNFVTSIANVDNIIEIGSISSPSMEHFYTNYILKEQPIILNNCINHWPALTKWKDQNYLLQLAGLRMVPVELGTKYTDKEWTQKLMTLEDFIKNHIYNTNGATGYLAQYQLFQQIPELMEDISEPEYCCFSEKEEPTDINAWYGPKGTISPLHHDPKKNLLAQVVGEKRIYIFPPSDSQFLYPHDEELLCNTARVDPRVPDLEKYPNYVQARPYYCVLKPGQLLYIPPKWWHFVESLSISFSVSFWWD